MIPVQGSVSVDRMCQVVMLSHAWYLPELPGGGAGGRKDQSALAATPNRGWQIYGPGSRISSSGITTRNVRPWRLGCRSPEKSEEGGEWRSEPQGGNGNALLRVSYHITGDGGLRRRPLSKILSPGWADSRKSHDLLPCLCLSPSVHPN